ncbi:M3 family metallopeptidase [Pseudenhygromyxa sp. WMMC2535]|uniref:M3 family metallopeptidase n=1 Tax=Pseudenhygromyxa sp. WMMC2535 TaxID=2712867 RepID=UPI0015578C89|nr:M3 family metallopeptidase [Pseudenhygromyxa sp. WMMC2535]NVB42830.1 M3 family metallopeptidase [Pseudenhygromyxa sp. WMMC2535]
MSDAPSPDLEQNPLVRETFRIPFDEIEPTHVVPAVDHLLAEAEAELQAIVELPEGAARTRENTLDAFESLGRGLEWAMGVVSHLESVATTDGLRDAYEAVQPKVSAFGSRVFQDPALFSALRDFAATDAGKTLDATAARLLEHTLDAFRRNGAELDETGKRRLAAIDVELAQLTTKYSQNSLDSTNAFELVITDEARLAGLPESAREAARARAEQKDLEGWRFTLQAPSWIPVLTYLEDRDIRRQIYLALNDRASEGELDNRGLIEDILRLREEKARLLGYASFADLVLEDRMAKTGEAARRFVDDLRGRSEPFFVEESAALRAFVAEQDPSYGELQPWDVGFWAERQRRALYDFDDEQLRPYFSLEAVLGGLFDLVDRLYGIRVEPVDDLPVWHESVRTYRVLDGERDLGCFYADLHPRESKRGGAWMNSLITGLPHAGRPHLGLICGNLSEPLGDKPALLTHNEVETVFHEFGHLLHHMLSEVEIPSLAGTNVAWDFVELPSQIMENWCWERESLDLFARHYQSGETIPEALFAKLQRARNFRSASASMRQLGFATLDLSLHLDYAPKLLAGEDHPALLDFAREVSQPFTLATLPERYAMICRFGHLFSSPVAYASGYYSYKWAEVLDADAFGMFKERGLFSPEVGARFRALILARGNSRDPAELFREFRGREPQLDALLEREGLVGRGAA